MKIKFVSDFFLNEVKGGAELVDDALINKLSETHEITRQRCLNFSEEKFNLWIVSNFVFLQQKHKDFLKDKRYIIIEHDHKFIKSRDVSGYKGKIAPADQITNSEFYRKANLVFCQSSGHAENLINNLILDNVANFGCSFWSDDHLDILENLSDKLKTVKQAIINSSNKIKGTFEANRFCIKNKIKPKVLEPKEFGKFMLDLSKVKNLIFFPQVYESFCRLILEARMLNCSVISNKNLGCITEDWFNQYKGRELINFVRNKQESNIQELLKVIEGKDTNLKLEGKKYPKISLITSMFKGEKYVEKFMNNMVSQTVFEHCELLIIDAVSPENEFPIIQKYMEKYPNIKYTRLEKDPGIYGVWNIGAKMATGKYLTNTNLDDIRSNDQIEVMVNCLEKNPHIDLAYSESYVTPVGNETFEKNSSKGKTYPITDFSKPAMIKCLPGCMPIWRKTMHDKAGYFDESFKYAGDHEMWLKAVRAECQFKKVIGVHGLYYMNPDGLSTSEANAVKRYKEEQRVFWEYIDIFGYDTVSKYSEYFTRI
jgi:GT2 family glycosyltransferase